MKEFTAEYRARFEALSTTNLSDAMDALHIHGTTHGIRPIWHTMGKVLGPAVTLKMTAAGQPKPTPYHLGFRAIDAAKPGDVVVVDNGGHMDSCWGGVLATGAKELPAFAPLYPARLYPRVLPTLAGITACETAGIPHRNIIAMQGPFTRELNVAVMHQFHIAYMVTKDGGAAGGFAEKAQAAAQCGVQLIVLRRPEEQGETAETILQRCRELL